MGHLGRVLLVRDHERDLSCVSRDLGQGTGMSGRCRDDGVASASRQFLFLRTTNDTMGCLRNHGAERAQRCKIVSYLCWLLKGFRVYT